jgi:hypothetical protein
MPVNATIQKSHALGGKSFAEAVTLTADAQLVREVSVNIAYTGTVTTQTSTSAGTLTLANGHNITTGSRFDYYSAAGLTYGCTAGTVSGTSVPFTTGAGVSTPVTSTVVTACLALAQTFVVVGNKIVTLMLSTPNNGAFVFTDGSNVYQFRRELQANTAWEWHAGAGDANPASGLTTGKVWLSHDNTTSSQIMRLGVLYNE